MCDDLIFEQFNQLTASNFIRHSIRLRNAGYCNGKAWLISNNKIYWVHFEFLLDYCLEINVTLVLEHEVPVLL